MMAMCSFQPPCAVLEWAAFQTIWPWMARRSRRWDFLARSGCHCGAACVSSFSSPFACLPAWPTPWGSMSSCAASRWASTWTCSKTFVATPRSTTSPPPPWTAVSTVTTNPCSMRAIRARCSGCASTWITARTMPRLGTTGCWSWPIRRWIDSISTCLTARAATGSPRAPATHCPSPVARSSRTTTSSMSSWSPTSQRVSTCGCRVKAPSRLR